jgi:hypothetical protein
METVVKLVVVAIGVLIVGVSFFLGQKAIQVWGIVGKSWVDLIATMFGATSFIVAIWAVVTLLKYHQGNWLLNYPLIGKPSAFTFFVPSLLAAGLGLALAKRVDDLKLARKR